MRKLAAIGASPKPREKLEDMRAYNKKAQKKARKSTSVSAKRDTAVSQQDRLPTPARTAWEVAEDMVASLPEKEQVTLIEARARLIGRKVTAKGRCVSHLRYEMPKRSRWSHGALLCSLS